MRLIDADVLGIGRAKRDAFIVPEYADGWNSALDIIAYAPTIDAVPVVRCKDCQFWQRHTQVNRDYGKCERFGTVTTKCNDFCSCGEKETG